MFRWVHIWNNILCKWEWIWTARHYRNFAGAIACVGAVAVPPTEIIDKAPKAAEPVPLIVIGPTVNPMIEFITIKTQDAVPEPSCILIFITAGIAIYGIRKRGDIDAN